MMRRLTCSLAAVAFAVTALAGVAGAERFRINNLVMDVGGSFSPRALPEREFAPIRLSLHGSLRTTDGRLPTALRYAVIDFDRNGRLDTRGVPRCDPARLAGTTTEAALAACRRALVGRGSVAGIVARPGETPFSASSPLLIFNGTPAGGLPRVVLHAQARVPEPETYVVPIPISRVGGRYRHRATLQIPEIAGGHGVLTRFEMSMRRVRGKGEARRSYLSARCPDGRLQARGEIRFADDSAAFGSVYRPCKTLD
jgi:hypothetical protein